jgi:hypothetical protein
MRSLTSLWISALKRRCGWKLGLLAASVALTGLMAGRAAVYAAAPASGLPIPAAAPLESASASDLSTQPSGVVPVGHRQPIAPRALQMPAPQAPVRIQPAQAPVQPAMPPATATIPAAAAYTNQNPLRSAPAAEVSPWAGYNQGGTAHNPVAAIPGAPANPRAAFASGPKLAPPATQAIAPATSRRQGPVTAAAAHRGAAVRQVPEDVGVPVPPPEVAMPGIATPGTATPNYYPGPIPADGPGFSYDGAAGCGACGPQWYVQGDALYFERDQAQRSVITQNLALGQFDFEFGGRITVGRQFDCLDGVEVSIAHFQEWDNYQQIVSPGGGLNSRFVSPFFGAGAISGFQNAVFQDLRYQSQLSSFEVNQRQFGWDVASSLWGFRYINLDEDFLYRSLALGAGGGGAYAIDTNNRLVGLQIGGDMAQPVTENLWYRGKTKIGGFANFSDHDSVFVNGNGPTIRASDDSVNFAFLAEVGFGANLQLTPGIALRAGYEFWYIWGLALAPEQIDFTVGPQMGLFHDDNGDMVLHGPSAGLNIVW